MATTKNELLKDCRGSLGEFVIYQCRGKTCIRRKRNYENIVYSPKQKGQQERIASTAMLYRATKAVDLQKYWQQTAAETTLSGYNLFVRHNSPVFTAEGIVSDFEKLQLTAGPLQLPDLIDLRKGKEGEWIMEWKNQKNHPGTGDNDRLAIALMKREDVFTIILPDIPILCRREGRAVFRIPPELCDYIHLFCYFCSATGEQSSKSRYFLLTSKLYNYGNF